MIHRQLIADESGSRTAALQDASAFFGTGLFRKVLECDCPLHAYRRIANLYN